MSSKGKTPLYVACEKGLVGVVKQLLECKADVGLTKRNWNKYPLMIASRRKFTDIAVTLLDRGADANVSDDKYQTPLKLASANGDVVLVKRLLDCGANVNEMQDISDTALHVAVVPRRGLRNEAFVNIVHMLLKSGAKPNALNYVRKTPLYFACTSTDAVVGPNVDIVKMLLEHGADPNIWPRTTSSSWLHGCVLPPLSLAAICGNSELATLLIKYGSMVDGRDDCGRTALHFSVDYDDTRRLGLERSESVKRYISTAEVLLSDGADINAMDTDGTSPLYLACETGESEIAEFLLSRGAKPDADDLHLRKFPIHIAAVNDNSELVELLLKHGANIDVTDTDGITALHYAVEHYRSRVTSSPPGSKVMHSNISKSVVDILLENKADVNKVNNSGETPLYRAVSRGLLDVAINMLQVYGANPNKGSLDKSPLVAACRHSVELVDTLLQHEADPNLASTSWDPDSKRIYPLFAAVGKGRTDIVTSLLNAGADVNVVNDEGKSVVCFAAETLINDRHHQSMEEIRNNFATIYILLQHGASFNMLMPDGRSPLYLAVTALDRNRERRRWLVRKFPGRRTKMLISVY